MTFPPVKHLGDVWKVAHVRGTPYNTGDGHNIAIEQAFAQVAGDWSGCHSVAWDTDSPHGRGDRNHTNQYTKSGYPLGLMLNQDGKRFVDEGLDFRNYTFVQLTYSPQPELSGGMTPLVMLNLAEPSYSSRTSKRGHVELARNAKADRSH